MQFELSKTKRDEDNLKSNQMNVEGIMLSEISQTEKDQILHGVIYMWNLKKKLRT